MKLGKFKSVSVFIILFIIWAIVTLATDLIQPIFLPSPLDIIKSYIEMKDHLPMATLASLGITLSGFAIGLLAGIALGLAIAYGIVKMHSGDISVESEEGKGTTFFIRLPVGSEEN